MVMNHENVPLSKDQKTLVPQDRELLGVPPCLGLVGVRQANKVEHDGIDDFVWQLKLLVY